MNAVVPTGATLIAYNVGFGDCLLLRVSYDDGSRRHVLIDFGSTALPEASPAPAGGNAKRANPRNLEEVANKIKEDSGGALDVVVVTHRHRDHISGFAGKPGKVIAALQPSLVLQPWTENPEIPPDATGRAGAATPAAGRGLRLGDVALGLHQLELAAAQVVTVVQQLAARKGVTRTVREQIEALGMNNIKNREAVENIQKLSGDHRYLQFGDPLDVSDVLPGVTIEVLGPPSIEQSKQIRTMTDVDTVEFWHLAASSRPRTARRTTRLFPKVNPMATTPQEARWVIPKIDSMRAEELLSLVRIMDQVLNNTSLILLVTIGKARLLFPGDAQLENWRYALDFAEDKQRIRDTLAETTLYKVGHHGSLNATPRQMLWANFARRGPADKPDRLITVMSTRANKHGSEDRSTEVPRKTLKSELETLSTLVNTQDCTPVTQWWREVEIPLA